MEKMKNIIYLLMLIFVLAPWPAQGQFRNDINVSLFTGGTVAQQNVNNQGYWYGVYAEWLPVKTVTGFNLGFGVVASQVEFKSNDLKNKYNGASTDFGLGLVMGKYSEFLTPSYAGYFGFNALLKRSKDVGTGKSILDNNQLGTYKMNQEDWLLSTELNMNLLKTYGWRDNIFPRTQLRLVTQFPLKSSRDSYWNDEPILNSALWNKASYSAELKQSLFRTGYYTFFEPKAYFGYYFYRGNKSHWLEIGPEFAFHKEGSDDFLAIYFLVKKQIGHFEPHLSSTQFVIGINFIPSNINRWY